MAAPQLRETADIWFDTGTDPVIVWDGAGQLFWLVDGAQPPDAPHAARLTLLVVTDDDDLDATPRRIAETLAEGLAACDFPPTEDGVPPGRARATLRAAGLL